MHYLEGTTGSLERFREVSGFKLLETQLAASSEAPLHTHANATIVLTLRGDYNEFYRGAWSAHPPLTIIAKPAGERHANIVGEQAAQCLVVELSEARVRELGRAGINWDGPVIRTHGGAVSAALTILQELRRPDDVFAVILEEAALELLAGISARRPPNYLNEPRWMREVAEVIHGRSPDDLRLAQIAAMVGVHPVHLARTFRGVHGCSIGVYARRLRVARAVGLLLRPSVPLGEVAAASGFYDQSHMGRLLRRATGMSPMQLRTTLTS